MFSESFLWLMKNVLVPKEEMVMERWEIPAIQEMNVEETAGGHYEDVIENECAHVPFAS
jgi:hypothetical protein